MAKPKKGKDLIEGNLPENEKARAVEVAVSQIERQFGRGAIMKLGSGGVIPNVQAISTGSLGLDVAIGIGGIPKGRVTEIFGPESSGKTTLCLHVIAEAQRLGGFAAFVDAEHALDIGYAKKLGVNTDELLVSQPDTGEQALDITEILVRSGAMDVVVIDSVAALVPRAEIEGDMGDSHMGLQARLMSQALRKLTAAIARSHTAVIFTNQIRQKIGIMFGNPETTTGGNALKFFASLRLDIRRVAGIKEGENVIGSRTRVKVVKNKLSPPFNQVEFDIMYNEGISIAGEVIDMGVDLGIVDKSGAWYSYGDERIGQGRENAKQFMRDNPETMETIKSRILEHKGIAMQGKSDDSNENLLHEAGDYDGS
ncbi:recombinase RecA [Desulfomonile tiedjei]|uniref:Protein RecA n=1 Tax=Desulfomonile tiedjei (strain ATCC 49306 / DSM 6799 / DCB-1) TaxID=706587 RepID=I4C2U8_DESTA|nr:recombinase RecA [Desulfomonile tiedjei]AFM23889.1 protein RecA [Desulfomonile tiedjei DSM 6799]